MKLIEVDFLKITSLDKHEFIISTNAVMLCPGLIKLVEEAQTADERVAETTILHSRHVVRCLLDYLHYKMRYLSAPEYNALPPFTVHPDYVLEVFKLAKELDI